jgi:hypothetical protein
MQRGNRNDRGCPGSPIFWIPPVKAWWEGSRWKGGFADCTGHAVDKDVAIYRYVTDGSLDAYMWQARETKARFIGRYVALLVMGPSIIA